MNEQLRKYALHGPYANQKQLESVRNTVNAAFVDAYIAAEKAESLAALRSEYDYEKALIDSLIEDLKDAQDDVVEERGTWNTYASIGGCLIGAALGSPGGPAGAIAGCQTGAKVVSTAADFAYDSELITTDKEALLQEYAEDLKEHEVDFSPEATRFLEHNAWQMENTLQDYADGYYQDFETFEAGFYGMEGKDYFGQFVAIGADFAASSYGESLFDSWNTSPSPSTDSVNFIDMDWYEMEYGFESDVYQPPPLTRLAIDPPELSLTGGN